jgi:hypothetical protein
MRYKGAVTRKTFRTFLVHQIFTLNIKEQVSSFSFKDRKFHPAVTRKTNQNILTLFLHI